ncbi:hypothetical protein FGB62_223g017 [Gracilaria domingensis]|nr:hypothetical protein FGB62_223g017 [Gracilaria domingensis]
MSAEPSADASSDDGDEISGTTSADAHSTGISHGEDTNVESNAQTDTPQVSTSSTSTVTDTVDISTTSSVGSRGFFSFIPFIGNGANKGSGGGGGGSGDDGHGGSSDDEHYGHSAALASDNHDNALQKVTSTASNVGNTITSRATSFTRQGEERSKGCRKGED